jgi:hypothetical protein
MFTHTHASATVRLTAQTPESTNALLISRRGGAPSSALDLQLLDRAGVPPERLAGVPAFAPLADVAVPTVVADVPAYADGMGGEYVKLERAIALGLEALTSAGGRTVDMGPMVLPETSGWPSDRAAYVVFNTLFRFASENPGRLEQATVHVAAAELETWRVAMDRVTRTMLGT